jgi:lysyl-tRNA synthetase class 2
MSVQWQPSANIQDLKQRAQIIKKIREFFDARGYWEAETPCMAAHGVTDIHLSNIKANFRNKPYALQTSPEYHMKRLLAAGSGSIYQIAHVFRDDELGRWHNPEFTLLEWYRLGFNHHDLMDEMNIFLMMILDCPPMIKKTYEQAFMEACDISPLHADIKSLWGALKKYGLEYVYNLDDATVSRDDYLYLLMSHVVEPYLGTLNRPVAVYDFPVSQASLAKAEGDVAHRFEVYYRGIELANGFYELTDAKLQAKRFSDDILEREKKGVESVTPCPYLLSALASGLPECSGVALGIDRLMTIALDKTQLSDVMSFDISRA